MAETEPSRPARAQRFERRMTDAEALMWNVEKDPWLNPSGGAISIHDRMPDMDHFRAQLAYTVATVPRLMEHVVGGVGRFSPPVTVTLTPSLRDFRLRIFGTSSSASAIEGTRISTSA